MKRLKKDLHIKVIRKAVAQKEEGQGLVEYALILFLVAVVVVGVLLVLGPQIGSVFDNVSVGMDDYADSAPPYTFAPLTASDPYGGGSGGGGGGGGGSTTAASTTAAATTPTPTTQVAATATPTTAAPTATPKSTATATPSPTATATATPKPTNTPTPVPPTPTPVPPTATPTPTPKPTNTPTPVPTATPKPTATPTPVPKPAAPANFSATWQGNKWNGKVTMSWSAVSGATMYYIYLKVGSGSFNYIDSTTSTSYLDTGVNASFTNTYYVTAVGPGGESNPSNTDTP
ncbi:MAG TPA: hypothetical protein VH186_33225 [Chloroflexia bacterium]|nr:hypothetical protein [Chloroflexia bacterium]